MSLNLSHTPGWHYALAYLLASLVILSTNPRRWAGWRCWGSFCAFGAAITGFMVVTDGSPEALFFPFMGVIALLIYLLFRVLCPGGWTNALYLGVRAFVLGELAAALAWRLFHFEVSVLHMPADLFTSLATLALTFLGIFLIAWGLETRYAAHNGSLNLTPREALTALLLGLSVFILSNLSYTSLVTPLSGQYDAEIFTIRALVDLGGCGMLYAYHVQLCELATRQEKEALENLLVLQHESYLRSEESIELVNRKYHDLKHQLTLLRGALERDEKLAIVDKLTEEIRAYEAQNKTGNRVLDTILTAKTLQCQAEGITLTSVAEGAALSFLEPMELAALFGNALDNAIESARKLTDPEKRLIHLTVAKSRGFVRVKVENCLEGEVRLVDGLPQTTKADARNHGYGVKSIRTIAEKHGGSLFISAEHGWFELNVLFPAEG